MPRKPAQTLTDLKQIRLNTLDNLIRSTVRLCRLAVREDADDYDNTRYRTILAYLSELRQQHSLKKNLDIESRLEILEKQYKVVR